MEFPPEHYFQTATQRMRQARLLFDDGASYALAIYVGGVAVECLLRAYKGRHHLEFDERHDLLRLFKSSRILIVGWEELRSRNWTDRQIEEHLRSLRRAINEIYRIWSNSYRFASEERLSPHLKRITAYEKIKGEYLKKIARRFLDSAQLLIDKGTFQWRV